MSGEERDGFKDYGQSGRFVGRNAGLDEINDEKKKIENLKRSIETIIHLYADKSHFIYELLQNADDARATDIIFRLYDDRLEVVHNGRPFTVSNLEALRDIAASDKIGDSTQIGQFGIGFKSVFGICKEYELYSNPAEYTGKIEGDMPSEYDVKVVNYLDVVPADEGKTFREKGYTTKFVFPFAVDYMNDAFSGYGSVGDIVDKLRERFETLSIETLLFMKWIERIEYRIRLNNYTNSGLYMLDKSAPAPDCIRVDLKSKNANLDTIRDGSSIGREKSTKQSDGGNEEVSYLLFSKSFNTERYDRTIDIAFAFTEKEGRWNFVSAPLKYISVFFPTKTESKVDFIVQGPYRISPTRDSVLAENVENGEIARETAKLLCDAVIAVRRMGRLNLSFLNVLPIDRSKFTGIAEELFVCLYEELRRLFAEEELLPCKDDGKYTKSGSARLVRGESFSEIFSEADITYLSKSENDLHWLSEKITEDKEKKLYDYLTADTGLNISVLDRTFIPKAFLACPDFLKSKSDEWLIEFYKYIPEVSSLVDRTSRKYGQLLYVPFVKTQDGDFVAPYVKKNDGPDVPNVFLPSKPVCKGLKYVDEAIYNSCEECRNFFSNVLGLTPPGGGDLWMEDYVSRKGTTESDDDHVDDIAWILRLIDDSAYSRNLKDNVLPNCLKLKCHNSEGTCWMNPYDGAVFLPTAADVVSIEEFFRDAVDVCFVDVNFYESKSIDPMMFKKLNVIFDIVDLGEWSDTDNGYGWWTLGAFRRKFTLLYLESVLDYIATHKNVSGSNSAVKSQIIFKRLYSNREKLSGTVRTKTMVKGKVFQNDSEEVCIGLNALSNYEWLHTKSGGFAKAKDISRYDLDTKEYGNEFQSDDGFCDCLGFAKTKKDTKKEIFQTYDNYSEEDREIFVSRWINDALQMDIGIEEIKGLLESVGNDDVLEEEAFPSEKIGDREKFDDYVLSHWEDAELARYEYVTKKERVTERHDDAASYLDYTYFFNDGKKVCQMCHRPYRRTSAIQIEGYGDVKKELPEMYMCLCGNCAKKYNEHTRADNRRAFLEELVNLTEDDLSQSPVKVSCRLEEGIEEFWFTQRHAAEVSTFLKLKYAQFGSSGDEE